MFANICWPYIRKEATTICNTLKLEFFEFTTKIRLSQSYCDHGNCYLLLAQNKQKNMKNIFKINCLNKDH